MHDLVIRGGSVVDGTGAPAREADVGLDGERVVAVGADVGRGKRELDARGKLVTPGWVDIHTHYDGQVTWDPYLTPTGWNGVTTVVMGNCGVGFAPVRPDQHDYLIQLMEGVEDIPGTALAEGIRWSWESFPQYLDAIEKMPRGLDVAAQVPHGALRTYVMGERGAKNEKATSADVAEMARLVREALVAGALGFSSSRTILHRAKDGEVVPGTTAGDEELFGIGRAMGAAGHGVFEVASDLAPEAEELRWMSQLSRETGRPVTFACLQSPADPDQWKRLLKACEADKAAGGRIVPQVAQRPAGLLLSFETLVSPFLFRPAFQALLTLPPQQLHAKLREPEVRAAIVRDVPNTSNLPGVATLIASAWHMIFPLGDPPDYEPGPEKSVAGIAARTGQTPDEVAYDLLLERDCKAMLYLPLLGYANGNFDALREMMMHPQAVFGLSDGGAHCGVICDASSPTFLLTHWVRDRKRGERIPLEHAVAGQTRRTAELYGLLDRGALVPGLKGDVNVIDLDRLHIHAPEVVYDLPASARRLVQRIYGYDYTVVSGQVTYEKGDVTGALPGKLLRGPRTA